ncbi:MAG: DUF2784 domain-containing protein [Pseudomonadota bacterium]
MSRAPLHRLVPHTVMLLHLLFVLFVVAGAGLIFVWPSIAWVHIPAVLWGAYVEFANKACPLTQIENRLRRRAGQATYSDGFISHYVFPVLCPTELTARAKKFVGLVVMLNNVLLYGWWSLR